MDATVGKGWVIFALLLRDRRTELSSVCNQAGFRALLEDRPRTDFAYAIDMTQVLIGLGAWFIAALIVGVAIGKMIAAADRAAGVEPSAHGSDVHRAV